MSVKRVAWCLLAWVCFSGGLLGAAWWTDTHSATPLNLLVALHIGAATVGGTLLSIFRALDQ